MSTPTKAIRAATHWQTAGQHWEHARIQMCRVVWPRYWMLPRVKSRPRWRSAAWAIESLYYCLRTMVCCLLRRPY